MCNKRRTLSKYNSWSPFLLAAVSSCLLFSLLIGCSGTETPMEKSEVILKEYPAAGEAIAARDFDALIELTSHSNSDVVDLAWRALAQTPVDDVDSFLQMVIEVDHHNAWFALSMHNLNEEQLEFITTAFKNGDLQSPSVCEVFYRQGNESALDLLLGFPEKLNNSSRCALAASTIAGRTGISGDNINLLFNTAFDSEDKAIRRNFIYGFYRIAAGGPLFNPEQANEVSRKWSAFGIGRDSVVDKYMVRILGQRTLSVIYLNYGPEILDKDIQLSIELARAVGFSNLGSLNKDVLDYLFNHKNNLVKVQVLESLNRHNEIPTTLLERVESEITQKTRNHQLFVESLVLLHEKSVNVAPYLRKLDFTIKQNPYLLNRALIIYSDLESDDDYYERLVDGINRGGITGMHSMRELGEYWRESENTLRIAQIRRLIDDELQRGERSVIAGMQQILMDNDLIFDDEYDRLVSAYQRFSEQGERDNIQMLKQILEGRFPDRFESIDEMESKPFRIPGWQRLYDMGTRPYWIIETEKGTIEVKLDPISAPFTVSSIDSLTRAGVYDGVVFHRVVKNFVIQGGDFDRRDGFGGPDYRIPTEPSFKSFERGAAGIASSGPDTEGGQFFFMHQWAPHLDGGYTNFGEVVRGMEVVDRIQIGDKITRARISIR